MNYRPLDMVMHSHPTAEFDILSRTRWLAEALASQSNLDLSSLVEEIRQETAQTAPEPDEMSWFAMERLAQKTGLRAARFERPGQSIAGASLVWVARNIQANPEDAKILAGASLVLATDDWTGLIQQARAKPTRRPSP
jgi:hypothetical protein